MVISHNLMAMNASRQYNITGNAKKKSVEKLSSGYKINRAADDAAGLSISEKMRRQIRGLNRGTLNTEDGISMCQVADGALAEVHKMLDRLTELSVQSANGTNSEEDRQAIQAEVNEILSEIDRISDTTDFNEQLIFQGAEGVTIIPATYEPSTVNNFSASGTHTGMQTGTYIISASSSGFYIDGTSYDWAEFSDGAGHTLADENIASGTYSFTYNGVSMSVDVEDNASMDDVVGKLNGAGFTTKIESSTEMKLSDEFYFNFWSCYLVKGASYATNSVPRFSVEDKKITFYTGLNDKNGNEITKSSVLGETHEGVPDVVCDIENESGEKVNNTIPDFDSKLYLKEYDILDGLFVANFYADEEYEYAQGQSAWYGSGTTYIDGALRYIYDGSVTLRDMYSLFDGMEITLDCLKDEMYEDSFGNEYIRRSIGNGNRQPRTITGGLVINNDKVIQKDVVLAIDNIFSPDYKGKQLTPEERIYSDEDKQVWIQSGVDSEDGMYIEFGRMSASILGIDGMDVSTESGAKGSLDKIRTANEILSGLRCNIGAQQNRLEHTVDSNNNTSENLQASESRLRDTDMAEERVNYSHANIIQQAAQSMLANANQTNQGITTLLQ